MDKTYAEKMGEAPFDWWKVLNNPPEKNSADHIRLKFLSSMWTVCACGNQCAIIPRYKNGIPMDVELEILGIDFASYVLTVDWERAKDCLSKIEIRAAELIKIELDKLNSKIV